MATVEVEISPEIEAEIDHRTAGPMIEDEEKEVGIAEAVYVNVIAWALTEFALRPGVGYAIVEGLIRLRPEDRRRYQPDLIYLSSEQWSRSRRVPIGGELLIVPEIAVEVVSPTNTAEEIEGKVVAYLRAGVRLVWIVHPSTQRIYVHENLQSVRVINRDGELDASPVLPGFRLAMSELFPEPAD